MMPLTGNGVTTPTPPVMPLRLDASVKSPQQLGRKGVVRGIDAETEIGHCHVPGCPKYDSKLVLRGDVKKTEKRLKAGAFGDPASSRRPMSLAKPPPRSARSRSVAD
jgi:hypothetical protein